MIDLENIKDFSIPRPNGWTIFGNAAQFDALPEATKDQVFFLNKEASQYLLDYAHTVQLITGGGWDPFAKGNFKTVETFDKFYSDEESRQALKKWLYHRGIPFGNFVFLLQSTEDAILTTWKMILRYSPFIFPGDDLMIFDQTLNWCLFYYHDDKLFFGKDNVYDPSDDEKKMEELNERKKKFPQFRHPYL
jgi:hypothetical protein